VVFPGIVAVTGSTLHSEVAPSLLRKINDRRVLEVIRQLETASRADVVRATGLTAPTVSKAVASLLKGGLLEERDQVAPGVGRPARVLRLASVQASVLGVVIDTPTCWVGVAGLSGEILLANESSFALPPTYAELLSAIEARISRLVQQYGSPPRWIGLSVPGQVNSSLHEVVFSPNLHMLDGHRPGVELAERLGIPCVMLQESHALCLGERMFGAARGLKNFAMLDVSTGLGLGVMSGGQLLTGHSGLAGELGHITVDPDGLPCGCGNTGCLETVATDSALCRLVSQRLGLTLNIEDIVQRVQAGELDVREELQRTGEYLAIAIAAAINVFNPSTLLIHGRLFELGEDVFARITQRARQRSLQPSQVDCRLLRARGSKRKGAIAGMLQHLNDSLAPAWT
jgi:predicted NBD/HSP70 family sugar kinase